MGVCICIYVIVDGRVVWVYAYVFMSMLMGERCGCFICIYVNVDGRVVWVYAYVFMSMLMGEWCGCVHMYLCQC